MRALPALGLAALLVVAGCAAPSGGGPADPADGTGDEPGATDPATARSSTAAGGGPTTADADPTTPDGESPGTPPPDGGPPDPETDVLGWEGGYWYDESIDVNQSDGLSDAELHAFVSRAMARVERIRGLEFTEDVPVEVITRAEYRRRTDWVRDDPSYVAWNAQRWEALFAVGEDADVTAELETLYGSNVLGYYVPSSDRLVVVSDGDGPPVLDDSTLVHELVHALQDQRFDLTDPRYAGRTRDADLAAKGLTEGEASYVETLYARRCGETWRCVPSPARDGPANATERPNLGLLMTVLHPYSDGPVYVDHLVESGGWAAVDAAHRDPPASTEQVIHRTDDPPVDVTVADRARDGWTRFEHGGDGGDTVGEAAIATMFWYQSTHYRADVVPVGALFDAEGPFDTYDYEFAPSAGWAGDRLVPYRNDGEYGYVWATEWDTEAEAREFAAAYREVLRAHDAERRDARTWVVPDGGFADAFHVARDGTRVTVVNAPAVEDLGDLRPGIGTES